MSEYDKNEYDKVNEYNKAAYKPESSKDTTGAFLIGCTILVLIGLVLGCVFAFQELEESSKQFQKELPGLQAESYETCLKSIQEFYPDQHLVKYGECEYMLSDGRFVYCDFTYNKICDEEVHIKVPK